ncbi:MAG: rhomboid family intramembrane serine protease [Pseudomonadota bacterium]
MNSPEFPRHPKKTAEPIFLIPPVILTLLGIILCIHVARTYWIAQALDLQILYYFSFIPIRLQALVAGHHSEFSTFGTFISYSFLHGSWAHVIVNCVWMLAFGSVVSKRFGIFAFLTCSIACSIFGALAHLAFFANSPVPMVGASAVISGYMGAAARFAFPSTRQFSIHAHYLPAQSLMDTMKNRQAVTFIGIWFAINLVFGFSSNLIGGGEHSIAWQAHIGGFLAGLILFPLFDKVH